MKKTSLKLIAGSLTLLIGLSVCTGCTNSKSNTEDDTISDKTGKIFTTEYDIEDYCENAVIVSKTNGTVYGLLDNKGNEILPLDYDKLSFANKDNYAASIDEELYLKAEREEFEMILDIKGNEICKSTGRLEYIDFVLDSVADENTPFFKGSKSATDENFLEGYKLYNKNGDFLCEIDKYFDISIIYWLSNKCYIESDVSERGSIVYNYQGEELHRFDGYTSNSIYQHTSNQAFYLYLEGENESREVIMDADGNIKSDSATNLTIYDHYQRAKYSSYTDKPYNLYHSNGTIKLEDWQGNALYEERYFKEVSLAGENECVGLTNEDNQLCIVGRNGIKYVDFGLLEYDDKKEDVYMIIDEEKKIEVNEIHEGKNSIIIPIKSETGFDIYYYNEIKK